MKKYLVAGLVSGFMAWGCLSAGVTLALVSGGMISKAVKKGEK